MIDAARSNIFAGLGCQTDIDIHIKTDLKSFRTGSVDYALQT